MKTALGILVAVSIVCLMGAMDYDDAVKQDEIYCANVADKTWPDYKGTYKHDCDGARVRRP